MPIPDSPIPITLNGIPIGTTELGPDSSNGTNHLLTDGHHFGHEDWAIFGTNGIPWEYRPDSKQPQAKRADPTVEGFYNFVGFDGQVHSITYMVGNSLPPQFWTCDTTQTSLEWEYLNEDTGRFIIEFASDIVETIVDVLKGDLTNIFFNALEVFA
ncbi:hypothetical protein V8C35DRAFT_278712 [Trichoderma chlorosporum]